MDVKSNNVMTKTDFATGMICEKLLWYKKFRKDLILDTEDTRLADEGREVGELAKGLFSNVVTVEGKTREEKIQKTQELISEKVPVIAEAAFYHNDLYCQVDILVNKGDCVEINEVKAVTCIRTEGGKLQSRFLHDAGFQHYVVEKAGYPVEKTNVVHLNKDYRRQGELEVEKLFVIDDVTSESRSWALVDDQVMSNVQRLQEYLCCNEKEPNETAMNVNCASITDPCPMRERCMSQIDCCDVWNLNGRFMRPVTKVKLFKSGIRSFHEVAESGKVRSDVCKKHLQAEITGNNIINRDAIKEFLGTLHYPLAYLDFETYQIAVPEYDNQWPYEKMPFQYSLDIVMNAGGEMIHKEFLANENNDPRRELAEQLIKDIPKDSCVIVYNESFEKGRMTELAELYPDLAPSFNEINENVRDIMIPFKNADYYTKEMGCSFSIKKVLPALYPEDTRCDYSKLPGVKNGKEAMNRFIELRNMDAEKREKERQGMLKYCGLDTYAMVLVLDALKGVA